MKTRDAFAFRNFDEQRILSRNFFRGWREGCHVEDGLSDEEILARFSATDEDSPETTLRKIAVLESLTVRVGDYQVRILQHGENLAVYARFLEHKIMKDETVNIEQIRARHNRAEELSLKYRGYLYQWSEMAPHKFGISMRDIGGLLNKIAERYDALDAKRKLFYRRKFAERLRQARKAMGLTQKIFADKLGMSQTGYMQYETARRDPSIPTLIEIAKKLQRPTDWLLGLTP